MRRTAFISLILTFLLTGVSYGIQSEGHQTPSPKPPPPPSTTTATPSLPPPPPPPLPPSNLAATTPAVPALGDVSGVYDILGLEAVSKESYHGMATVTKTGEIYNVKYKDDESSVDGVGLVEGGVFSIAYISEGTPAIFVLKKMPDGSLRGPWAYKGESQASQETWKRR
ncbi:MAG: hypothetical protein HW380_1033 [Magnetococcales bacterium]|nr:hypothetical protein [Magnetococcales bacterium]